MRRSAKRLRPVPMVAAHTPTCRAVGARRLFLRRASPPNIGEHRKGSMLAWARPGAMKAHGFRPVILGAGGPGLDSEGHPKASLADQQRAIELNRAWDQVRAGQRQAAARTTLVRYAEGSVSDGYQRAMALRKAQRVAKGIIWTTEQEKRWSLAILTAYLGRFGAELMDTTPLFWTRGGRPLSRVGATGQWSGDHGRGRHVVPRPYTKSSLNQDFRTVRALAFGKLEKRCRTCAGPVRWRVTPAVPRSRTSRVRWPTRSTATSSSARPTIRRTHPASAGSMKRAQLERRNSRKPNKMRPKVSHSRPL
jgi:hypothetical protein